VAIENILRIYLLLEIYQMIGITTLTLQGGI